MTLIQTLRRTELKQFGQVMGKTSVLVQCYDRMVNHLEMIDNAVTTYSKYVTFSGDYHGLSFRPSTYKLDPILQFIPVNLQYHNMIVSSDKTYDTITARFLHVTFGAPAAHIYRFRSGLRQLIAQHRKLVEVCSNISSSREYSKDTEYE